jgi:outer membrane protein assembly factor BamB
MLAIVRSISTSMVCFLFAVAAAKAAPDDWFTYRHDSARTGAQPIASDLSDPRKILGLHVIAQFPPDAPAPEWLTVPDGGFTASPIVVDGTAFIGGVNGYFYAFDAASGAPKWQYPKRGASPLSGSCGPPGTAGNYSFGQYGIRTGATYAVIRGQPAVIFGAPDPSAEGGFGSARLFALPLSPADPLDPQPIWQSDVVAHVSGCTGCTDRHVPPCPARVDSSGRPTVRNTSESRIPRHWS